MEKREIDNNEKKNIEQLKKGEIDNKAKKR